MTVPNNGDSNANTPNTEQDVTTQARLNAIFGIGHMAFDIAKMSDLTPEQQFRKALNPGVLAFSGQDEVCTQIAIQVCRAASGQRAIMAKGLGTVDRTACFLAMPGKGQAVKQAIQNQESRIKKGKFFFHELPSGSGNGIAQMMIQAMTAEPDLLVMAINEVETGTAGIDYQKSNPDMDAVHAAAINNNVTVLWMGDSTALPAGAGTIRVTQEPGHRHHTVVIEQKGLGRQTLILELDGGARLGTYAKSVTEAEILGFLKSEGGAAVKMSSILKRFAMSNMTASTILRALCEKGDVEKPNRGYYAAVVTKTE